LLATVLFAFPLTLGTALFDPDEGLHASIAQEMVEQGDWITPHAFGKPFRDKPILYFWAEALSLACFGMNEAAVRLPGLLFGLAAALTTGLVGTRMFGRRTGMLAGAFYATMLLPAALSQSPVHDIAMVAWVNLAILWFWEAEIARGRWQQLGYILKLGLVLGLACLTKGLSGVAVVGLAYGGYLILVRLLPFVQRLRATGPASVSDGPPLGPIVLRGVLALLVAALVAAIWYMPMERQNPGYLRYFFLQRHVMGYATQSQLHGGAPVWYYLPILLLGGLPWISYLPATLRDAWQAGRREQRTDRALLLLAVWLVGGLIFFSLARSKLLTYIWPLFPAVAVLAARPWSRWFEGDLSPAARRDLALTFRLSCWFGPITLPAAVLAVQAYLKINVSPPVWIVTLAAATTAAVPLWFWSSGRREQALAAALAAVGVQFVVLMTTVTPRVAELFSARELAAHFNAEGQLPARVLVVDERIGSLVFYLDKSMRMFLRDDQLQAVQVDAIRHWPRADDQTQIVVSEQRAEKIGKILDLSGVPCGRAGRWQIYAGADLRPRLLIAVAAQSRHASR
jgi:4-amino-4-deoxy-L-arabinose transferase-like glycosyltransferase